MTTNPPLTDQERDELRKVAEEVALSSWRAIKDKRRTQPWRVEADDDTSMICEVSQAIRGDFPEIEANAKFIATFDPQMALRLLALLAAQEAEIERKDEALRQIEQWANAYPLSAFPEPDWAKSRAALKAEGQTIDAISASAMRHVLDGVLRIIHAALSKGSSSLDKSA